MLTKKIINHLYSLRTEKKYRLEHKSVLISGKKMVQELGPYKTVILQEGYINPPVFKGTEVFFASKEILKKITGLQNPEGIAAEMKMPASGNLDNKKRLLCLDGVADPGNLGTLLRTALALGWEGVFITENSVDPFNDKALRAAKGATFHLPLMQGTHEELLALIKKNKLSVLVADKKGTKIQKNSNHPLLLILGNEAHGSNLPFTPIAIPMHPAMESLNVASAGAILMHELL